MERTLLPLLNNCVEEVDEGIKRLFPEILEHIFSFLDLKSKGRVNLVCKAWRDASYRKSVWRGVEAKIHINGNSPTLYFSLWRRGIRRVHVLSLKTSMFQMIKEIDDLESLSFSGCTDLCGEFTLDACSVNVPPLKILDFSDCKTISDRTISTVTKYWKNLEVLRVGGCSHLTNTSLGMIAWSLSSLKILDLRSVVHISDNGIVHCTGIGSGGDKGNLKLEHLSLEDCPKLTNLTLEYISQGLHRLQYLNLAYCIGIDDEGLQYLGKMTSLRELILKGCDVSDLGIGFLSENGANYKVLDLSFCERVGDEALVHISQSMFNLRSLSLCTCRVTDSGLVHIANALKKLESLYIGQCHYVTDASMKVIANSLKSLKVIDVFGCTGVTSYGLDVLRAQPRLDVINHKVWRPEVWQGN